MSEKYIYEIQAFAYSDFVHHILIHEKRFTKIQFRKMIEIARQKAKTRGYDNFSTWLSSSYPDSFIQILKDEFGFEDPKHLVAYVGCDYDDICEVELE